MFWPAAVHYYIPSFMSKCVEDKNDSLSEVFEALLWVLTPPAALPRTLYLQSNLVGDERSFARTIATFNRSQCGAIVTFLEFMTASGVSKCPSKSTQRGAEADAALKFWRRRSEIAR